MFRITRFLPLLVAGLAACAAPEDSGSAPETTTVSADTRGASRNVDVAELQRDLATGAVGVLIDVRTPGEFASGHVAGAQNVPLDSLEAALGELRAVEGEVYVICRSGSRSRTAAATLQRAGLRAVNVSGGTLAWVASGGALE